MRRYVSLILTAFLTVVHLGHPYILRFIAECKVPTRYLVSFFTKALTPGPFGPFSPWG